MNRYEVNEGDTIYQIARFYNIALDELLEANPDVNPDLLHPGKTLFIPVSRVAAFCPPGSNTYTIQKDDTLYSISKKFDVSLSTLLKANTHINPEGLLPGQSICIPTTWSAYKSAAYRVAFKYPFRWRRIDNERYAGIDGFFEILAVPQNNLEEACRKEAFHKLKPYGSGPELEAAAIQGQTGCFIYPSQDQHMEMRNQAALIVAYGEPLLLSGALCHYFILRADKEHIRDIANTLSFIAGDLIV